MDYDTVKQCAVAGPSRAQGTQMSATAHRQYFDSEQVYDEATSTTLVNADKPNMLGWGKQKMLAISQSRAIRKVEATFMQAGEHIIEL